MDPVTEADALLRGRALDARDRLDDAVGGTREKILQQVEEHPVRALAIAVGAGVLLGMLLRLTARRRG